MLEFIVKVTFSKPINRTWVGRRMCGIGGVVSYRRIPSDLLQCMEVDLASRGPDDKGFLQWTMDDTPPTESSEVPEKDIPGPAVALIHRRLSILDLSPRGHQPMAGADGRYWIVFNGEVYNFKELRTELESLGYTFKSDTDSEVVLSAFLEWGEACLPRFIGMFAACILDTQEHRMFFFRDPFGIKPLYYCHGKDGFAFGSNPQTLLHVPWVSRKVDAARIYTFLATGHGMSSHGSKTMFADIAQVAPGCGMHFDLQSGELSPEKAYWHVPTRRSGPRTFHQAAKELRGTFLDGLRIHLRSDVPIGILLSGGIDSSSIACGVRHILGPDAPIHTFTYAASDERINEEKWADIVNKSIGATPHKIHLDPETFMGDIHRLIREQGEPFGSTSIYAGFRVYKEVRDAGVIVVLDGQGADETMAGYNSGMVAQILGLVAKGRLRRAKRLATAAEEMRGMDRKTVFQWAVGQLLPGNWRFFIQKNYLRNQTGTFQWLDHSWFQGRVHRHDQPIPSRQGVGLMAELRQALTETSIPAILRYVDRNSMAHGVESRVPFLTVPMIESLLAMPPEFHMTDEGESKAVFRAAMRGIVPDPILDRKDKIGFQTTEGEWVLAWPELFPLIDRMENKGRVPFVDWASFKHDVHLMKAGTKDYTPDVWRILNIALWAEEFDVRFD